MRDFSDGSLIINNCSYDSDKSLTEVVPLTRSVSVDLTTNHPPTSVSFLCLLFLVRLGDYCNYIVNSWDFYSYSLIGKLTVFFQFLEFIFRKTGRGLFHFLHTTFSSQFKSRVGLTLTKSGGLRIILNIDINFSSINLAFIFRCSSSPINPVSERRVNSSTLVF
jgi:hypothetical protein